MSNYYRDVKTTASVADAYRTMYATPNEDILNEELIDSLIEDVREEEINEWLDYIDEAKSVFSVPKQNMKKVKYALTKLSKRHPKVKVTFGTQSKGKFVDDNMVNFDGSHSDIDNLFKAIQKDKALLKMMEGNELEEGALADKAKKSGISVGTLRKVYNRGMAAWKTGHRPGTTPQQWGMARVNAFISKKKSGKLNHDQDLAQVIHPDDSMLDEGMKLAQIVRKHKSALMKAKRTGNLDLPKKVEDDLSTWASNNGDIRGDDPDEFDDWIDNHIDDLVPTLKIKESVESQIDEVKKQEVDAMKKVSKDMQKVLVSYQKIANMGDKELKNTIHNKDYKKVLDARDTILKMIGTLNTKMLMQKENFEIVEASAGAMIDKLFKTGGDKMMQYGIAKLLNMTGVGVAMSMQKQNPVGFKNTMIELGKAKGKVKMPTNDRLLKMFKQQGVKPLPEELDNDDKPVVKKIINKLKGASKKHAKQASDLEKAVNERVKDGKLDPLSKMGKSKLTGSEINQYYRDNPKQKAAARDKSVKKAIELALDLSGATNYAIKEIEKFKRGLSKHPAVKLALRHANESKEFTGHHVVIENLSPANVVKLKTFGKMMAKMTKLPFDENDPEKSIDKLMGQIWKQKHVPANWERLHKMVAMLRDIGVKMPSLKGKYMGLDPVTKKAIFYKEGTEEIVEWHQKIEDIKEGIEELVEKKEMSAADIKKIAQMTDRNDHTGSLMHLAKLLGDRKGLEALKGIMMTHKALGHMPDGLMRTRNQIYDNLMRQSSSKYSNHKDVISSF